MAGGSILNRACEEWRPVNGFAREYHVSNFGRVKSLSRYVGSRHGGLRLIKERILSPYLTSGYPMVRLQKDCELASKHVHQLVAYAFLGAPPGPIGHGRGKWQVNHKDGDKGNPRVENLEWVTQRENLQHAIDNGLVTHGERNGNSRITTSDVVAIRLYFARNRGDGKAARPGLLGELARRYDITPTHVHNIVTRKAWRRV